MTTPYSTVSKILHWVLAFLILALLAFGNKLANSEPNFETLAQYNQHKLAGLFAFILILWRLIERLRSGASFPGGSTPSWEDYLARTVHILFYAAMIAMPITGYAASSAAGQSPVLFGVILPSIAPQNTALSDGLFAAHGVIGKVIFGLFILHLAGLFKRLIGGDPSVMTRMTG
ncbi:MAG: cytochrome b/b6 domain-containing protein [Pseudomonadota bacterium]